MRIRLRLLIGIFILFLGLITQAAALNITGAGASLPYPVYAKWADQYHKETRKQVNYQSIGSGGGQQQIITGTVAFGATDDPISASELNHHHLIQFPAIIGGIVPVINLPGFKAGELKLTGELLADIYLGRITTWNNPKIQAINPDIELPKRSIVVVHRSDGSGTTFNWTNYLAQVSDAWRTTVGVGKAVKWPTGQGGKGNEGVAAYVRQLSDSIGYVEFAYAVQNQLAWTLLQNKEGNFVAPNEESFSSAAIHANWSATPGMGVVLANEAGAQSWPITAASFILMKEVQKKPEQGKAVLAFFDWAFKHGAEIATELHYVPLPEPVVAQIEQTWSRDLKTAQGQPLWP